MASSDDILALRDLRLRQRVDDAVKRSRGQFTRSAIMRAAISEKLDRVESELRFTVDLAPPKTTAEAEALAKADVRARKK